jgi:hypothetical protein
MLAMTISLNSCKSGLEIDAKACPSWIRNPAKYFTKNDAAIISVSGREYLYDLQQEYEIRCEK